MPLCPSPEFPHKVQHCFGAWLQSLLKAIPATWIAPIGENNFRDEVLKTRTVVLRLLAPLQSATCFAELVFRSLGSFERNSYYSSLKQKGRDLSSARVNLQYHAVPPYQRVFLSCNLSSHRSVLFHDVYVSAEEESSGFWKRVGPVRHSVSSPALPQISWVIWISHLSGLPIWG